MDEHSPLTDPKIQQIVISYHAPKKLPEGFLLIEFKAVFSHSLKNEDKFIFEKLILERNKSAFLNWLLDN